MPVMFQKTCEHGCQGVSSATCSQHLSRSHLAGSPSTGSPALSSRGGFRPIFIGTVDAEASFNVRHPRLARCHIHPPAPAYARHSGRRVGVGHDDVRARRAVHRARFRDRSRPRAAWPVDLPRHHRHRAVGRGADGGPQRSTARAALRHDAVRSRHGHLRVRAERDVVPDRPRLAGREFGRAGSVAHDHSRSLRPRARRFHDRLRCHGHGRRSHDRPVDRRRHR